MGLELINKIKKEKGMTSKQLSEKSKIPIGTLNKILNGQTKNPAYETIFALANALECSVDIFCNEVIEDSNVKNNLSQKEVLLLENYNKLNNLGKEKLIEYSNDLIETPKYIQTKDNVTGLITATKEEPKTLQDLNPILLAAHDDNLTQDEKIEMDRRILEALKKQG